MNQNNKKQIVFFDINDNNIHSLRINLITEYLSNKKAKLYITQVNYNKVDNIPFSYANLQDLPHFMEIDFVIPNCLSQYEFAKGYCLSTPKAFDYHLGAYGDFDQDKFMREFPNVLTYEQFKIKYFK